MEVNIVLQLRSLDTLDSLNLDIVMDFLQIITFDLFQDVILIWATQTKIKQSNNNDIFIWFCSPIKLPKIESKYIRIIDESNKLEYEIIDNSNFKILGTNKILKLSLNDVCYKIRILRRLTTTERS